MGLGIVPGTRYQVLPGMLWPPTEWFFCSSASTWYSSSYQVGPTRQCSYVYYLHGCRKIAKRVITAPPCTWVKSKNTSLFCNHSHCDFSISTQCFLQIASSWSEQHSYKKHCVLIEKWSSTRSFLTMADVVVFTAISSSEEIFSRRLHGHSL